MAKKKASPTSDNKRGGFFDVEFAWRRVLYVPGALMLAFCLAMPPGLALVLLVVGIGWLVGARWLLHR